MSVAAPARRPRAPPFVDPLGYARHRPETTLLYQLVAQHYPAFRELREDAGRPWFFDFQHRVLHRSLARPAFDAPGREQRSGL